jgi:hypothetical protein
MLSTLKCRLAIPDLSVEFDDLLTTLSASIADFTGTEAAICDQLLITFH